MPRSQGRPIMHEDETRSTILRIAQQLFMEHGYRAVSTRQIADGCGLTQPALYHHFADKQDLYVAVMKESLSETQAALERILRRSESVQERMKRMERYLLSNTERDHTMMMHDIQQELSVTSRAVLNEAFQVGIITPIRSLIEEGIRQGILLDAQKSGVNATTATYLFISMLSQFLQHSGVIQRDVLEREHAEEVIVQLLFHGMATTHQEYA